MAGLTKDNLNNCFNAYLDRTADRKMCLGYMEACLIQFEVIEQGTKDLDKYSLLKPNNKKEDRAEIIVRLVQNYLTNH